MVSTDLNFRILMAFQIIRLLVENEQTFVFLFMNKIYQFCRF
jgi:hypothetical protein